MSAEERPSNPPAIPIPFTEVKPRYIVIVATSGSRIEVAEQLEAVVDFLKDEVMDVTISTPEQ